MDNHHHIRCRNVYLSAWRGGWEEGWGEGKRRGIERGKTGVLVVIQIGSDWWDLAQRGPVLYSQLLMATQTEHLTLILLSFSPGTSLGQQSHTLPLTPSLLICLTPFQPFPLPPMSTSSSLCVWNLLLCLSQDHRSQTNRLVAHT